MRNHVPVDLKSLANVHKMRAGVQANFVACHNFNFLERIDVLKSILPGGIFLLNSSFGPEEVWDYLPQEIQELQKYGISKIYSPDDGRKMGLEGMIEDVIKQCDYIQFPNNHPI